MTFWHISKEFYSTAQQSSPLRLVLSAIGLFICLVGFLAFISSLCISTYAGASLEEVELPFGDAEGIAVSANDEVYVGSRSYRRVSRYLASGEFDRSWHVPHGRGSWKLETDTNDNVYLAVGGGEHWSYFLIADAGLETVSKPEVAFDDRRDIDAVASDGRTYLLHPIRSQVQIIDRNGESHFVGPPLFVRSLGAPLPAWLIMAFGLVLFGTCFSLPGNKQEDQEV